MITAISGTVITLDTACVHGFSARDKVSWRAIATPTSGTGRSLPTVTVSWGFPIQERVLGDASFVLPKYEVAPNEGGTTLVRFATAFDANRDFPPSGARQRYVRLGWRDSELRESSDYERGFWSQSFGVAAGDVLTLTWRNRRRRRSADLQYAAEPRWLLANKQLPAGDARDRLSTRESERRFSHAYRDYISKRRVDHRSRR